MTPDQRRRRQGRPDGAETATGVMTMVNTVGADGEGVTIAGKAYVFQDILTNVDGNVKVGATLAEFRRNLLAAITLGPGAGILYAAATVENANVKAFAGADLTLDIVAKTPGAAGNSFNLLTSDGTIVSVSGATLTGGNDAGVTISPLTPTVDANAEAAIGELRMRGIGNADGETFDIGGKTYTFDDGLLDINGHIHSEVDVVTTLANIIAAITLGPGAGTAYAALMTLHPSITAVVGGFLAAAGVLTLTGNAADGNTVTIDGKVYTFQTSLTNVDGNVLIGATASDSLDNLIAAITLGAGAGTEYAAATTLHTTVTAAAGAGDTMDATAKVAGGAGNLLATIATLAGGSWAFPTLKLGSDNADLTAKTPGAAGNALAQLTSDGAVIGFDDTSMSGGADAGVAGQQMTQTRTLFGKDVSNRGGFPTWKSDDENVFQVSQPDDADGDGVVEDEGGFISGVADGVADVAAEFPGVVPVVTAVTLT